MATIHVTMVQVSYIRLGARLMCDLLSLTELLTCSSLLCKSNYMYISVFNPYIHVHVCAYILVYIVHVCSYICLEWTSTLYMCMFFCLLAVMCSSWLTLARHVNFEPTRPSSPYMVQRSTCTLACMRGLLSTPPRDISSLPRSAAAQQIALHVCTCSSLYIHVQCTTNAYSQSNVRH